MGQDEKDGRVNPSFVPSLEEMEAPRNQGPITAKVAVMEYKPGETRRMLKNVIAISIGFLLLFTAFQSMSALQSSLHSSSPELGNNTNATLYAALVISCMFLPTFLIRKFTVKWTLFMSMFGYSFYIAAQFHAEYYTMIPAAIIVGMCAAPLWSSKCTYLTLVANQYATTLSENAEVIVVRFFGIFFLFFQSASIVGNLISSLVLSSGATTDLTGKDIEGLCGSNYKNGNNNATDSPEEDDAKLYTLAGIYLGCSLAGAAFVFLFVDPLSRYGEHLRQDDNALSGKQLLVATFKQMTHPYQIFIIPLTIWSGLEQGFFNADYTAGFITCSWGVENVGYVLICYGVCDALSSVTFGPVIRRVGRIPVFVLGACVNLGVIIFLFIWTPNKDQPFVFFIIAGLWGLSDAIWQTQINAFYGVLFSQNEEPAFSNYRLWESLGFIIAFILANRIRIFVKLIILLVCLTLGMLGYFVVEYRERKRMK